MKRGYYLAQIDEETLKKTSVGVSKKILDQLSFFNSFDNLEIKYISLMQKLGAFRRLFSFFKKAQYNCFLNKIKEADFIYIRAIVPCTKSLIFFLKTIKSNYPKCKILWEIPTYPYDNELIGFKNKVFLFVDKINRKKLNSVVDYIVTFSNDKEIWNCQTLHIMNGINIKRIPLIRENAEKNPKSINLIAVAQFNYWHGYDRIIKGMKEYYSKSPSPQTSVNLHLVGSDENVCFKELIDNSIKDHVFLHGEKYGTELDDMFNIADIAVCSLGCHRRGTYGKTSELKSREYLARGLPIITSTGIDIIPDEYKYSIKVVEDDSPINIEEILSFVNTIYYNKNKSEIATEIRSFAEKYCTMEYGMESVIKYITK